MQPRERPRGDVCPEPSWAIVVPTLLRSSLETLLRTLASTDVPVQAPVILVDDRPARSRRRSDSARVDVPSSLDVRWLTSDGRGPAAARNAGWRSTLADWIVFLDDDVEVRPDWTRLLIADLVAAESDTRFASPVVGVQGQIAVPLPAGRPPTDWERSTAGLAEAKWATADLAYRRRVLVELGGFDERFPRAYREDADFALRAVTLGHIEWGARTVDHPVRPAPWTVSVRRQAGNADDVLMRRKHGASWKRRAGSPTGRRSRHALVTLSGGGAIASAFAGHRKIASLAAAGWLAGTAELTWARVRSGPRTRNEIATMVATSVAIPPAAIGWWLAGLLDVVRSGARAGSWTPGAVFFDRDGTLIEDVPYNGDPELVRPKAGAQQALDRLRERGLPIALVSNQSGVGTGRITSAEMRAVNRRTAELLGPFDLMVVCPHAPSEGCGCRKPAPGMLLDAAARLGIEPSRCVMVGDIDSDMSAAERAGTCSVLVPDEATRREEVAAARVVAADLDEAVDMILAGRP